MPFAPLTNRQIAASRSTKDSLRQGEDRALVTENCAPASGALELATGRNVVMIQAPAFPANRLALSRSPAKALERVVSLFLATLVNLFQRKGAAFGGKEEVLGYCHHIRLYAGLVSPNTGACTTACDDIF